MSAEAAAGEELEDVEDDEEADDVVEDVVDVGVLEQNKSDIIDNSSVTTD